MALPISTIALLLLLAFIFYKLISVLVANYQHARNARSLGCQPVMASFDNGFLGYKNIVRIGTALVEQRLPDFVSETFRASSAEHGRAVRTITFWSLGERGYHTIDPENIKAVLATSFSDFDLGSVRKGAFEPLLGDGIFSADGPQWQHSRDLLRPQFARQQVADLDLEEEHLQHLLRAIPIGPDGWTEEVDLCTLFFRLTVDSATEFLFGESADSQLAALPSYTKPKSAALHETNFADTFDAAVNSTSHASRFGPFYKLFLTKAHRAQCKRCHDFIDHYVHKALSEAASPVPKDNKRYIFLDALATSNKGPLFLRPQLISILLAGRDTTAGLLSWIFYLLVQHPHVLSKLRATVLETFGTFDNPRNVTFEGLKGCAYLQCCLNETLRLFPAVPINTRRAIRNTTLPRGGGPDGLSPVYMRAGQEIVYSVCAMQRQTDIWGSDADEFVPERFENRKHSWEYLPFNGGPRICLGQQFALTEAGFVVVRLLQRFAEVSSGNVPVRGAEVRNQVALTSRPGEGVKVRLKVAA